MKDGKLTIEELADRFDIVSDGEGLGLLDNHTSQIYRITEGDRSPEELHRLALDEMRNPVGAFDQVLPGNEHPLAHLLKGNVMPTSLKPNNGSNFAGQIQRRFGADQEAGEEIDAQTLLHFVILCMEGLPNDEQDEFRTGLQGLLQQGASDARYRSSGRRPAQDAALRQLNNKSFQDRWPMMRNVRTSGY